MSSQLIRMNGPRLERKAMREAEGLLVECSKQEELRFLLPNRKEKREETLAVLASSDVQTAEKRRHKWRKHKYNYPPQGT